MGNVFDVQVIECKSPRTKRYRNGILNRELGLTRVSRISIEAGQLDSVPIGKNANTLYIGSLYAEGKATRRLDASVRMATGRIRL